MICPLKTLSLLVAGVSAKPEYRQCDERDCAWWFSEKGGCCSITAIAHGYWNQQDMETLVGLSKIKNPHPFNKEILTDVGVVVAGKHYAFNEGVKATVQYLEEPCTEHPYFPSWIGMDKLSYYAKYKEHRYLCPNCWQELKES